MVIFRIRHNALANFTKPKKFSNQGTCSQFGLLFAGERWAYLNQTMGRARRMSKTSINKNEVFDDIRGYLGTIRKPSRA